MDLPRTPPIPRPLAGRRPAERRTVLTTGVNSGIGLATAIEVARRGYRSIGTVRSEAKAALVEKAAADAGVTVETVLLDVTDADRCEEVLAGLDLYGLVNNAGFAVTGAVEDVTDDQARHIFETMVLAPTRLARLALPAMRAAGEGRIIQVSSLMGRISAPLSGWYTAAKHALETLSDSLRVEVAGAGIDVVLVEPGGFKTGIWDEFRADIDRLESEGSRHRDAYDRFLRFQQLLEPVMGEPDHVGRVIADLLQARRVRSRYLVGVDAQMATLASRLTPTPVLDRVLRTTLGL